MDMNTNKPTWAVSAYDPPVSRLPEPLSANTDTLQEMRNANQAWTAAAEVWSLGAVLYHMMVGQPPQDEDLSEVLPAPEFIGTEAPKNPAGLRGFWLRALPQGYSTELRDIVKAMMHFQVAKRPTVADLSVEVDRGMRIWREDTEEGRRYRLKGEKRRFDLLGDIEEKNRGQLLQ